MDQSFNPENRIDQTRLKGSDEDMISNLPDSVLQHILAFVSTKDAVRTSTLSIRWQNLWKLVPCLDLDTNDFYNEDDFLKVKETIVKLRGNSDLKMLKLTCDFPKHESSRFETWIYAVVTCKLEPLDIQIYFSDIDGVKMPSSLYMSKTLVVLNLDHMVLDIPEFVSLSSLKIINLEEVLYPNDSAFKSFVSGCPVLEELRIIGMNEDNLKVLCICSLTLKRLTIALERWGDSKEYGVVIDTPHLEYLRLRDHRSESFVVKKIGLPFEANINVIFNVYYGDELEANEFSKRESIRTLLAGISNVRSLNINWETLEILSQYRRLEALPQFNDLIHLEATFGDSGWEMLPALFECCMNLKIFILKSTLHPPKSNPLTMLPDTPQCMSSSLELITLESSFTGNEIEMDLVRYFLEYSAVLKQMKVRMSMLPTPKDESIILKKILTFPRRSSACRVIID